MKMFAALVALLFATSAQAAVTRIYDADIRVTVTSRHFFDYYITWVDTAAHAEDDDADISLLHSLTSAELGLSYWLPTAGDVFDTRLQIFRDDDTGKHSITCDTHSRYVCVSRGDGATVTVERSGGQISFRVLNPGCPCGGGVIGGSGGYADDGNYRGVTADGLYSWAAGSGVEIDYQIDALAVRPVPVAASGWMLLAGLGALALRRRPQRAL